LFSPLFSRIRTEQLEDRETVRNGKSDASTQYLRLLFKISLLFIVGTTEQLEEREIMRMAC
jgi:hypothetical protein